MRLKAPLPRALAVALALASPAAFANDITWDERGGAALRVQVAPGKVTEWCGVLRPGDDLHWEFESAEPLEMNVHYHEGQAVTYPVEPGVASIRNGRLSPQSEQTYCWMWTNRRAAPVALQAKLQKVARGR